MLLSRTNGGGIRSLLPNKGDVEAFVQDVQFALGRADERHPNARQFAGYKADEVPMLSYIGKGVVAIFTVELILLMVTGLLIWQKSWLISVYNSQSAAMAFVAFHGLLGIIMLMGIMFHTFEHGFHPAFYPVEMKAFLPKEDTPSFHGDPDDYETEPTRFVPMWGNVLESDTFANYDHFGNFPSHLEGLQFAQQIVEEDYGNVEESRVLGTKVPEAMYYYRFFHQGEMVNQIIVGGTDFDSAYQTAVEKAEQRLEEGKNKVRPE
jgi:hypothetical protein